MKRLLSTGLAVLALGTTPLLAQDRAVDVAAEYLSEVCIQREHIGTYDSEKDAFVDVSQSNTTYTTDFLEAEFQRNIHEEDIAYSFHCHPSSDWTSGFPSGAQPGSIGGGDLGHALRAEYIETLTSLEEFVEPTVIEQRIIAPGLDKIIYFAPGEEARKEMKTLAYRRNALDAEIQRKLAYGEIPKLNEFKAAQDSINLAFDDLANTLGEQYTALFMSHIQETCPEATTLLELRTCPVNPETFIEKANNSGLITIKDEGSISSRNKPERLAQAYMHEEIPGRTRVYDSERAQRERVKKLEEQMQGKKSEDPLAQLKAINQQLLDLIQNPPEQ